MFWTWWLHPMFTASEHVFLRACLAWGAGVGALAGALTPCVRHHRKELQRRETTVQRPTGGRQERGQEFLAGAMWLARTHPRIQEVTRSSQVFTPRRPSLYPSILLSVISPQVNVVIQVLLCLLIHPLSLTVWNLSPRFLAPSPNNPSHHGRRVTQLDHQFVEVHRYFLLP